MKGADLMQTNVNGLASLPSHQLAMTLLMTPDMANFMGNVHGGTILRLLDQVAYACASRYAGSYVVTLSVDQVTFRGSIHVGELVTFLASVNYTGNTSLEIGIKVIAENIRTHVARRTGATSRWWQSTRQGNQPRCRLLRLRHSTNVAASRRPSCARRCGASLPPDITP
jgi:acyl-CoA hydrolase